MATKALSEFYALDRKNWKEVPEKYVLKSGYIYGLIGASLSSSAK
jgi:hypothetical protein